MIFGKFLDPKNDVAFKQIFGQEKNKDILIPFLNEMLTLKGSKTIQDIQFLKPNLDPDAAAKKQSVVDVLCQDHEGPQYIVEMQVAKTKGFEKRAQYYAAKTYSKQLFQGDEYTQLKEVIFLAITDFIMFKDKTSYKSDHVILDQETHEKDLKDLAFTFVELPKFNKTLNELSTVTDRWLYFFKYAERTTEQDAEQVVGGHEEIGRAYEVLNRFSWTDDQIFIYEQEEKSERDLKAMIAAGIDEGEARGRAEGRAEGLAKGLVKGRVEGEIAGKTKAKIEIARKMIQSGMSIEAVVEITGLTRSEIENT